MAITDLCKLEQVLEYLQKREDDSNGVLQGLIERLSVSITEHAGRQFVSEGDDASERRFLDNGSGVVLLTPFDAREILSVSTQSQGEDPVELADSEWEAEPYHAPHGVYTTIRIAAGKRQAVVVEATWGFESVPRDVEQLAIATVVFTYRKEVAAYSGQFTDGLEQNTTYELPPFTRAGLARYRTPTV